MRLKLLLEVEEQGLAEFLTQHLRDIFKAEVETYSVELEGIEESYDRKRSQFNAISLLKKIHVNENYVLLITGRDLYVPGFNFVFGYAPGKKGVVSTYRLSPATYGEEFDRGLYFSRILKEVIHEVGHMVGLMHCTSRGCVMSFSNTVYDVDRKLDRFCDKCSEKLSVLMT